MYHGYKRYGRLYKRNYGICKGKHLSTNETCYCINEFSLHMGYKKHLKDSKIDKYCTTKLEIHIYL